jgi:hypothetical protein
MNKNLAVKIFLSNLYITCTWMKKLSSMKLEGGVGNRAEMKNATRFQ